MTQTLRIPLIQLGSAGAVLSVDASNAITFAFQTTNLVSYVDDLVFYEDEIVEY